MTTLKVPPHNEDAEQAVLGALMLTGDAWDVVSRATAAEDFYRREHRLIYQAMVSQVAAGQPIDIITLSDVLTDKDKLREAGGLPYLEQLVMNAPGATNLSAYAKIVRERALERRLISIAHSIADSGYNAEGRSVSERISEAQSLIDSLQTNDGASGARQLDAYIKDAMSALETRHDHRGELLGVSTGFDVLDWRTQGLQPDQLVVIAGRPGMGKSALAVNIAEHVAMKGGLVIVFSLEMPGLEIANRILSSQGRIPGERIRSGDLQPDDWDKLSTGVAKMRNRQFYIDDDAATTSGRIASSSREIARRAGQKPALIVVDYLQLLADKGESVSRVTQISRNLKLAAKSLHCPVIALSQLNRGVEGRADKRPLMSDLRESGSIEADADIIWMLYRDEVYDENSDQKGVAEVITRKLRAGQPGTDRLVSRMDLFRFENMHFTGGRA